MSDFSDKIEQDELLRQDNKTNSVNASLILAAGGSAGRNPVQLARLLTAWDMFINVMNWQDRPIANLTHFITSYQASIDAKYHNDFKDVLIAEEIERRRQERKGVSILQQ